MIFFRESQKLFDYLSKAILIISLAVPFASNAESNNSEVEQIINQLNGKTFWYYPTVGFPNYCKKNEIRGVALDYRVQLKFNFEYINSTLRVTVNDSIQSSMNTEHLQKDMVFYSNDEEYLNVCFSDVEPVEHYKKIVQIKKKPEELKKKQEELAAKNKKGGVRIGMSSKQVREKTDWGSPESINSTITSNGTREQWVYGYGDYLYFRNGILESIQVRK
jgi:hypothetical protein